MRTHLVPILAAISTPPHLPAQYFEEMKRRFRNLEGYFKDTIKQAKQVSQAIEEITGYEFRDPIWELPYSMRSILDYLGTDKQLWDAPFSARIQDLQDYAGYKNRDSQIIRSILKRLIEVKHDRSDYFEFFKAYANFLKEYPGEIKALHDFYEDAVKNNQLDDYWEERLRKVSDQFQTYRTALDAVYKYITIYINFASKVEAFMLRNDLQVEAFYGGEAYPERRQRPPHKPVEVLYHAGVDVRSILSQGFKTRKQLGEESAALGGGPDDVISFTADIQIARALVDAVRDVVKIAHGQLSYDDVVRMAQADGVSLEYFDNVKRDYGRDDPRRLAFEAYRTLLTFSNIRYNPAFFGVRIENFIRVRLEDIGIIAAKVQMSEVTEYLREMEEFRVPLRAILSMKRVLY